MSPNVLVLMEVPPFKKQLQGETTNQRINEFSQQINKA